MSQGNQTRLNTRPISMKKKKKKKKKEKKIEILGREFYTCTCVGNKNKERMC